MAAEPRPGLAALPGYDTAPDIYETPDLTDDTSTTLASEPARSPSPQTQTSDDDDGSNDGLGGVSRRRLYPARARSKFAGTRVEGRGVDLGDRVGGLRKGYRVRETGREDEGLRARIARLRREVEECRILAEKEGEEEDGEALGAGVEELGAMLARLEGPREGGRRRSRQTGEKVNGDLPLDEDGEMHEQTMSKVADFDGRLLALERALGVSSLDAAGAESAYAAPLIPSLALLDQQLSALTSATSLTSLEAASSRIQKLKQEADSLARDDEEGGLSDDDLAKLNALHTLLPTLQSLAPTLPPLITRLRSLRTLHAGAATAAQDLEDVERRQREMEAELKAWREGLEKVEEAVQAAGEANGRNGKVVDGWVRELEGRVKALG